MRYFAVPFHICKNFTQKHVKLRRVSSPWGKVSLLIFLWQEWEEILKLICGSLNPRQWRGNQGCGTSRGSDAMTSEPKLRSVFKLLSLGVFLCSAPYLSLGRCALCFLVSNLSVAWQEDLQVLFRCFLYVTDLTVPSVCQMYRVLAFGVWTCTWNSWRIMASLILLTFRIPFGNKLFL